MVVDQFKNRSQKTDNAAVTCKKNQLQIRSIKI